MLNLFLMQSWVWVCDDDMIWWKSLHEQKVSVQILRVNWTGRGWDKRVGPTLIYDVSCDSFSSRGLTLPQQYKQVCFRKLFEEMKWDNLIISGLIVF